MNIKFHTVIDDITGKTGVAVIEAIIAGERNAANFLPLIDRRIKAEHETIQKSLQGNWRDEHLAEMIDEKNCSINMDAFAVERFG